MRAFLLLLIAIVAGAGAVLEWDPNPSPDIDGYRVFHGFASRQYVDVIDVGNTNQVLLDGAPCGVEHFLAVTAYTIDGMESDYSEEVSYTPRCQKPDAPGGLRISSQTNFMTLDWSADLQSWETIGTFESTTNERAFFRLKKL